MVKEIKWNGVCSGRYFEGSALTEQENFLIKKQDGFDMIGFVQIGKKRNTWLPLGANINEIVIYHAESGRKMETIYSK